MLQLMSLNDGTGMELNNKGDDEYEVLYVDE